MNIAGRLLVLVALAPLAGCGAGVIAAVFAGSKDNSSPPPSSSITVSQPLGPLVFDASLEFYIRRVVLRGTRIPADADPELRLAADLGGLVVEDVQQVLTVEGAGDATTLSFAMRTTAIQAAVADPQAADVPAELVVLARRDTTATELFRTPFLLLRQPILEMVPNDPIQGISVVSVLGGELELSVVNLPDDDPRDLFVEVATDDPNPASEAGFLLRRATNLRTEPDANDPARTTVRCTAPSWPFPGPAFVRVGHQSLGRSSVIFDLYYQPELTAAVPRRGSTDGGELVSLTGLGLVRYDFLVQPPQLGFNSLSVFLEKGGVTVQVDPADIRPSLSSLNNVVFVMPPSPDGRPGPVTVRLRPFYPPDVDVEAQGLFAYGARAPDFGPRGVAFGAAIVGTDFATRDVAADPRTPVDAVVVEADASGVPVVRVLESRGNGTFSGLGLPIQAGNRGDFDQRFPLDVAWGEFHGDGYRDVFVANRGTVRSAHTVLRGVDETAAPLRYVGVAFRSTQSPERAHIGRFDDDALDDVLVVGRIDAQNTTEYAMPVAGGGFTTRQLFSAPVPLVEASMVADLDGDGFDDLAFAAGGAGAELRLLFGEPGPLFGDRRSVDLVAITELFNGEVVGIGVTGPAPDRIVVAIVRDIGGGAPSILLLPPSAPRVYGGTSSVLSLPVAGGDPVRSLTADLNADGVDEVLVARDPGGLSLWIWDGSTLVERSGAIGLAPSATGRVTDLAVGAAIEPVLGSRLGVFVTHDAPLATGTQRRITTLLVDPIDVSLLDPLASRILPAAPTDIVLGELSVTGAAVGGDVFVASAGQYDVLDNDGVGELTPNDMRSVPGLVGGSVAALSLRPGDPADGVVMLLDDGRMGYRAAGGALAFSVSSTFEGAGTASSESRLAVGDVDGDGLNDVVLLLAVDRPSPPSTERSLLLLRGRDPLVDPFPFIVPVPSARTAITARAVSLALGELAFDAANPPRLEVALAVGRDDPERGILFHRLEPGGSSDDWSLVRSVIDPADPRVAANLDPALVLVQDLELDGLADLIVVSGTLDVVQVFRQTGQSTRQNSSGEVDPLVFASTAERVLPSGQPVAAHLADLDGDGIEDVVVQVRLRAGPDAHAISVAISNGLAGFAGGFEVSSTYIGAFGPDLVTAVGDVNGDALGDLVLGWSGDTGTISPQLRILFGTHR